MSADNGIYIGHFADGKIRVIHAQAIDNIYYPDGENAFCIVEYFKDGAVFDNSVEARQHAYQMADDITNSDFPILEYGISSLEFHKTFAEYEKEVASGQRT